MRRAVILFAAIVGAAALASTAGANFGGPQLAPSQCGAGKPVLDVSHAVVNDADSGFHGYWAADHYLREIKVWKTGPTTYCAIVKYAGVFQTFPGALSPGAGLPFTSTVVGLFGGGYRATITGTLAPGSNPTRGFLGVKDYQCNSSGTCASPFSWVATYFQAGYGFAYNWWGWNYKSPHHGSWTNAIDGSSGDITP